MGLEIDRERFTAAEYATFAERLTESLVALRALLARPDFGLGEASVGVEVEMHLVDARGEPFPGNAQVLASAGDARLTLEINRFNLELNPGPVALAGRPFSQLARELGDGLARARVGAAAHGARIALVGTLPTLRAEHLADGVLSDAARYRALSRTLREMRGEPFSVRIKGRETLATACDDVALEGANASLQVHLRVAPARFAAAFNAAQLAAAPLLAASANSPFFDGKSLWDETRIALFQQAVDTRVDARERARIAPRVAFGHGWVRDAYEPFAENVALHPPLLPVLSDEDPRAVVAAGGVPRLEELRLHHGTVWSWNRAIFAPDGGGHLRIEHRVLPSGPTLTDMLANAALTLGLTLGLAPRMDLLVPTFPFHYASQNLYAAAKHGLEAELLWPSEDGRAPSPRTRTAGELVLALLPVAQAGLTRAGVAESEAAELLDVVRARVVSGRTGAVVQRELVAQLEPAHDRSQALAAMLERYLSWSERDVPVHTWLS